MFKPLRSWKPLSDVKQLATSIATLSAVDDPFFTRTHAGASTFPLLPLPGGCTQPDYSVFRNITLYAQPGDKHTGSPSRRGEQRLRVGAASQPTCRRWPYPQRSSP
jgi:hypothetical protein